MCDSTSIDIAIVGAGVIGLTIARSFKLQYPEWEIAVFDKMPYVAEHASGRNSGVLHAGLYYPSDSLKKRFCLKGLELWSTLARELGIDVKACGKYICARADERLRLEELYHKAQENGADLRWVSESELQTIKKFINADYAFYSMNTKVIDPSDMMHKLLQRVQSLGVYVLFDHQVTKIESSEEGFNLYIKNQEKVFSRYLINAGGNGAVSLRLLLGLNELKDRFVKGAYLKTFRPFYNESLLYSLPLKDLEGLGVHSCIDFDGTVKFGPNAVECADISYAIDDDDINDLKSEVLSQFKIQENNLHVDFSGIRAKVLYQEEPFSDFWIKSPVKNYVELCGIESPGLTSSPAIAEYVKQIVASFEHNR